MSSYLDTLSQDELLLKSSELQKEYRDLRQKFFAKAKQFYNQSVASTYHKEDDLIRMCQEMKLLKDRYLMVRDALVARGVRQLNIGETRKSFDNEHTMYKGELLHTV